MNKFLQLVENVLLEASYEPSSIINLPYTSGGLADMSGPPSDSPWGAAWNTKPHYRKSAFYGYAVFLHPERGEKYKNEGDQDVIFVKRPSTMKMEDFNRKLDIFLEQGDRSCDHIERIPSNVIDFLNKREMKCKEWWALCGRNPEEEKVKINKPGTKFGSREEGMAKIKAKAKELAIEKRDILISNGVSKEDAVKAAKEAYHKFIQDFYNKSNLKVTAAGGPIKATNNPLMHKGVHDRLKAADENKIKQKATQLYKDLLRAGTPEAEAKLRARKYYERLINPAKNDN